MGGVCGGGEGERSKLNTKLPRKRNQPLISRTGAKRGKNFLDFLKFCFNIANVSYAFAYDATGDGRAHDDEEDS